MAKPKTELAQKSPPPRYTHWNQRGEPVLLTDLELMNGKTLRLSLQTQDPDVAKRYMRPIVGWSVAQGHLSPDSGAAKEYRLARPQLEKIEREVHRLKAVPDAEYRSEALATAKRWDRPVGVIHYLVGRKPPVAAGTYKTRRTRRRDKGQKLPMADTWEHRPQGGKYFFWNGKVLTARLQIDGRTWQWPLKGVDSEEKAEALMAPIRVAGDRLRQTASEAVNFEEGTEAAEDMARKRRNAHVQLAGAIIAAGGPTDLADFVLGSQQIEVGTTVAERPAAVTEAPTGRSLRQTARKDCLALLI